MKVLCIMSECNLMLLSIYKMLSVSFFVVFFLDFNLTLNPSTDVKKNVEFILVNHT
jgi:hypothetical protein